MSDGKVQVDIDLNKKGFQKQLDGAKGALTKLGFGVKAGFAALTAAGATAAASFGAITKSAYDAYSQFQQLEGGVSRLFGSDAQRVMANAQSAFKRTGQSANQYMEQVTSFSASLISSLAGDTAAAVDYADIAMQDMADNANTFGTDMASIEYAYQGFAKQNYTMLDNLKLGYGGTKEEMQRLIDDANRVKEANGEMADLSIESFADVIEAIHIMQEEMNIAGTTANEAATTLEGSFKMMTAAWDNWLTALGDPNADLDLATQNLVDSMAIALSNAIPKIAEISSTLFSTIVEKLGEVFAELNEKFYEALPPEVQEQFLTFKTTIDSLIENLPTITGLLGVLAGTMTALWIATNLENISSGLLYAQTWIGVTALDALAVAQGALNAVMNLNPFVRIATLIMALVAAFLVLWNTNEGFRNACLAIWESLKAEWVRTVNIIKPWIDILKNAFHSMGAKFMAVVNWINGGISSIISWFKGLPGRLVSAVGDIGSKFMSIGRNIVDGLKQGIANAWAGITSWFSDKINGLVTGAKKLLGIKSPSRVFRDQVGKQIAAGIRVGYEKNDPMKDIEHSLGVHVDKLGMSVGTEGADSAGGFNQVINVNQPVATVDELARAMRHNATYGLAGAY